MTPIKVLLADDQAMVRAGFRMILEVEPDLEVVGEAQDGEEAVELARRLAPDVVVMDIRMPRLDGIAATRRILAEAHTSLHVVVVTTFDDDASLLEALRAGAGGFLLKNAPPETLIDAVRTVASGDGLLAPAVTRRVIQELARGSRGPSRDPKVLDDLTARELDVLRLIARGRSNAEIAQELSVSQGTTKTHVSRLLMKLNLRDRVEAVVLAYETGFVQPGDA